MDNLLYFLRFKALDRYELSKRIVLFVLSVIGLLYLINLGIQFFIYNHPLGIQEFLVEFSKLLSYGSKSVSIWVPEIILVAIFGAILLWSLAVAFPWFRELLGFVITWITTFDQGHLELEDCLNNVEFQGLLEKEGNGFLTTSSGSGMLFKHFWRDFEAEFELKFKGENGTPLKTSYERTKLLDEYITANNYLGFIFRARDFDNYFMLSIGVKVFSTRIKKVSIKNLKGKKDLLITPHVKVGGAWDVFTENSRDLKNFNFGEYTKIKIKVKSSLLKLWVGKLDGEPLFTWHLPTHYLINWGKEKKEDSPGDSSKIPFRTSIGRIGFRAYGEESFLIKNLTIKSSLVL